MTNAQYKATSIAFDPTTASTTTLRPNTVMTHAAQRQVGAAQDGVCAGSRRVLGTWGCNGAHGFHVPSTGVQAVGAQTHPDRDNWVTMGSIYCNRLTPGCFVRARIYFVGSGSSAYEDPAATWNPGGPFGAVQLSHTWTQGASSDGPHAYEVILPASALPDAGIPGEEAGYWHALDFVETDAFRPDAIDTPATGITWVEDVELQVEIELRGAPRIHSIVLYEEPLRSIYLHSDDGPHAVNGQSPWESPQTQQPQIEAADGATYDENRFGTHRMLGTAARQQDVVGPVICNLLAFDATNQDDTTDLEPFSVSSATFVDIVEQGETTYDRARAGFICAASHAQVHYLCDADLILLGTAAVIPGRAVFEARLTGAAVLGVVRVQSGEFEWVDVDVTSTSWTLLEATGYFETQVAPDHAWATIQVFGKVDADTVEVRAVAPCFGE